MDTHAHRLFDLIDASPEGLTVDELRRQAAASIGAEATYCTCSIDGLSFDAVVDFFQSSQKVVVVDGRMQLNRGQICNH
jgi:probable metal-binding protein